MDMSQIRNKQYWLDLVYEGERLTEVAEGTARDLSEDIAETAAGRAQARRDGEQYRVLVGRDRKLDPNRPEHQLQDVIDAYRWNNRAAASEVRLNVGYDRPGR